MVNSYFKMTIANLLAINGCNLVDFPDIDPNFSVVVPESQQ